MIAYVHGFTLVIKNSYTYCKVLLVLSQNKVLLACPEGGGWEELTIARLRPETTLGFQRGIEMLTYPHHAFFQYLDKWEIKSS